MTTASYANGVTSVFTYNAPRGWLMGVEHKRVSTTLMDLDYTRAATGRISTVTSAGATAESWVYGYDDLDRLLNADNVGDNALDQSFTYALNGNPRLRGGRHDFQLRGRELHLPARLRAASVCAADGGLAVVHLQRQRQCADGRHPELHLACPREGGGRREPADRHLGRDVRLWR